MNKTTTFTPTEVFEHIKYSLGRLSQRGKAET